FLDGTGNKDFAVVFEQGGAIEIEREKGLREIAGSGKFLQRREPMGIVLHALLAGKLVYGAGLRQWASADQPFRIGVVRSERLSPNGPTCTIGVVSSGAPNCVPLRNASPATRAPTVIRS